MSSALLPPLTRRRVLKALTGLGIGTAVFQRAVAAEAKDKHEITAEMLQQAEWIAGIELHEDDRAAATSRRPCSP